MAGLHSQLLSTLQPDGVRLSPGKHPPSDQVPVVLCKISMSLGKVFCRYLRVKYEDLIETPLAEVSRLYSFMSTEVTREVTEFLSDHTGKIR